MADEYPYLLPQSDAESEPYWAAAKKHELRIQRCSDCQRFRHPPQKACPHCYSERSEWALVSGRGTVYTFIRVVQPVLPQWRDTGPYNIVQIALEEDPSVRVVGNVSAADAPLRCDLRVEVTFDDVSEEITIPRWKPV